MKKFTLFLGSSGSGGRSSRRKMASCGGESSAGVHRGLNDLQFQKSPYLLQHKCNPVEWHPWSPSTHQLAVTRNVPIFLSIGYSTCHWCHVMERESFENPAIAAVMNEHFVNIKIDREEHPDVDRVYMSFVQAVSGSGGWPLSVWMTPQLKPIYGGTYYPPDNRYFGRPGFKSLLLSISEQWEENRQKCEDSAENIYKLLQKSANIGVSANLPAGTEITEKCVSQLRRSYEPSFGGFSEAPKFPQPGNFVFLLDYCVKVGKRSGVDQERVDGIRKMVERSLVMMAKGGIYDHVGKGFARYSTDKKWHVPHFEKMLYDQAQLLEVYANTFKLTGDEVYARVAGDIVEYVLRDLRHPLGGFFSAEDADSENKDGVKREGAFYVWTSEEIDQIVDGTVGQVACADVFKFAFGVKENGNVDPYQDPHDELKLQNVLFEANNVTKCAEKFGIGEEEIERVLGEAKAKLFEWRNKERKRPGLDDKVICSWNGLMIRGLSVAALAVGKSEYLDRAVEALRFCREYLVTDKFDLYRTCYAEDGTKIGNLEDPILGCVDDFANLISGCLGVFQASGGEVEFLEIAVKLQDKQDELFWDEERGGYFNSRVDPSVIIRMKDDDDGAEPSSNSTSLRNLLELSQIGSVLTLGSNSDYSAKIPKLIKQFTDRLEKIPVALPIMSALVNSYTEDLFTKIVFDGSDTDMLVDIGKSVRVAYGSVLVPVRDKGLVREGVYVDGKIVVLKGKDKTVASFGSVQELNQI